MKEKGFTLVELLITISIVAILASLTAPAMFDMIKKNRLTSEVNNFAGAVRFARSEAVKRNTAITIDRASNTNRVWDKGWTMYTGDTTFDSGDTLLRENQGSAEGIQIRSDDTGNNWLGFKADGTLDENGNSAAYYICDDRGASQGKAINISKTGRATIGDIPDGDDCTP